MPMRGLAFACRQNSGVNVPTDTARGVRPRLGIRAEHLWRTSMRCLSKSVQPAARGSGADVDSSLPGAASLSNPEASNAVRHWVRYESEPWAEARSSLPESVWANHESYPGIR
jgi:hypothetical protein